MQSTWIFLELFYISQELKICWCVIFMNSNKWRFAFFGLTRYIRQLIIHILIIEIINYSFGCRSNSLQNTNIPHSAFISPKIINGKDVEEVSCIETQDNQNSEGEARNCCETSVRQDSDSSVSDKQRQTIIIADSPSPAVSVITISSDTDEEETSQRHSLRE